MDIVSSPSAPGRAVLAKQFLQFLEKLRFRSEMAEMGSGPLGSLDVFAHFPSIIAMNAVTFGRGRVANIEPMEEMFERSPAGPAPEEPVMEMIGNFVDMVASVP